MKIAAEDRGSWLCEPRVTNAIDREQLKALARRYLAGQSSVVWLCELLEQHPEIARSAVKGSLREAVTRRLQAVAIAQAGIRTELERLRNVRPGTVSCLVQTRLFLLLRSLVDHDALGIFLNRMTRDDAVERVETDSLIAEIEAERARDAQTKSRPRSDEMPNAKAVRNQRFTSVRAAFDAARAEFGIEVSGVVFSDRAAESAQDSPFLRPDDVYDALRALFSAVQGWRSSRDGAMGTTFKELLRQAGYNEKRCSESTVANYRNEYTMFVRGRVVEIGQHMTLGSGNPNTCLSIHWWRDEAMKDLIIGHCGRHLTNSLS